MAAQHIFERQRHAVHCRAEWSSRLFHSLAPLNTSQSHILLGAKGNTECSQGINFYEIYFVCLQD